MAKVKVKVKDKVECQSCKCFNVKRKDVKGRACVHEIIQYEANKVENEQKSCTTCRKIKFTGLMQALAPGHAPGSDRPDWAKKNPLKGVPNYWSTCVRYNVFFCSC
jgi:hypothetical protein